MSAISSWILGIAGVVLVGVLVEMLLLQGKLNKLLKSIVAVATILIIVSPLKNINISTLDFSNLFEPIAIDNDFVESKQRKMLESLQLEIENNLATNGYQNVVIKIEGTISGEKCSISNVFVKLENLVLIDEKLNIDKYTNIVAIIKKSVDVKEENIIFYE